MPMIYDQEAVLPLQRICLYGDPKTGKTPLVSQLPLGDDYWGEAVYVAADDGSEAGRSFSPENRKFVHIVKPAAEPGKKYDPAREAWEVIMTDWRKEWPGVKTMIWDTMTETGLELLANIADTGQFSDKKHITIGDPGGKYTHNLPMQGDYMGAQDAVARMLKALFKLPLNLVVLFHTAIDEKDNGTVVAGGPATVGKATIRQIAKPFDAVLRLEKKSVLNQETKKAEQAIIIHTEASGIWIGGVRTNKSKALAAVTVPAGKPLGAFWPVFENEFYPDVAASRKKQTT